MARFSAGRTACIGSPGEGRTCHYYCWWFRNPGSTHQLRLEVGRVFIPLFTGFDIKHLRWLFGSSWINSMKIIGLSRFFLWFCFRRVSRSLTVEMWISKGMSTFVWFLLPFDVADFYAGVVFEQSDFFQDQSHKVGRIDLKKPAAIPWKKLEPLPRPNVLLMCYLELAFFSKMAIIHCETPYQPIQSLSSWNDKIELLSISETPWS